MKLSMWMIINRLSDFNINWYIESDSRPILKSARMTYAPQCLQISQMGDDVICRGGDRDYFLLEGMDYKQAFEVLQGIFDYYNDWDEQIRNAARAGAYQSAHFSQSPGSVRRKQPGHCPQFPVRSQGCGSGMAVSERIRFQFH